MTYKNKKRMWEGVIKKKNRLSIFRSNKFIYAQVIDDSTGATVVSASSIKYSNGQNVEAAEKVGRELFRLVDEKKIDNIYFLRKNRYLGRVKALIESARKEGLKI
jgi:large subunit ribosomal protein L18